MLAVAQRKTGPTNTERGRGHEQLLATRDTGGWVHETVGRGIGGAIGALL